MAKTLLNCLNEIFKRTSIIEGDAGEISTLTDSARQVWIDKGVQIINEAIDELYSIVEVSRPNQQAESSFTLVATTRAYSLASDLVRLHWPLIDKTNNQYINEFRGGYNGLLLLDPEQDDTGLPLWGAIRATDGKIHLDRAPTSVEAGRVYTYQYDKDTVMSDAADTVPFNDTVFRAMVPAWAELFNADEKQRLQAPLFRAHLGRAARLITQQPMRDSYSPR